MLPGPGDCEQSCRKHVQHVLCGHAFPAHVGGYKGAWLLDRVMGMRVVWRGTAKPPSAVAAPRGTHQPWPRLPMPRTLALAQCQCAGVGPF